jgi:hypothetical protein
VLLLVLDPRISYEGMKEDYADDETLTDYLELESAKTSLLEYFAKNYAGKHATPSSHNPPSRPAPSTSRSRLDDSPQKVNFTTRYKKQPRAIRNEVLE